MARARSRACRGAAGIWPEFAPPSARGRGIEAPSLFRHYLEDTPRHGLMLGYAGVPLSEMKRGVATLASVMDDAH